MKSSVKRIELQLVALPNNQSGEALKSFVIEKLPGESEWDFEARAHKTSFRHGWLVVDKKTVDPSKAIWFCVKLNRQDEDNNFKPVHSVRLISIDSIACWLDPLQWDESKETYESFYDRMKARLLELGWDVVEAHYSRSDKTWRWTVYLIPDGFCG